MEEINTLEDSFKKILTYNVVSVFSILIILVIYGVAKDYILYSVYNTAATLYNIGMLSETFLNQIVITSNVVDIIPQYLDLFWLLLTVTLFVELIIASYYSGRKTWFSSLGLLTFGVLVMLFLSAIFTTIATWVQSSFITNLFSNLVINTPFFNFYMTNITIINILMIGLCVLANFIDLDISGFEQRKQRESLNQEEVL